MPTFDAPAPTGSPVQDRIALQGMLDSAPYNGPSLFLFGEGTWRPDRPLRFCGMQATFRGLGPNLSRIWTGAGSHDALVLGINARPNGVALDPAHLPDAFGVLDSSAAPRPGVRRGFRTLGIATVAQAGGGLDHGPPGDRWYSATRTLLIEAFLDLAPLAGRDFSLAGMRDGGPRPWSLICYRMPDPTLIFSYRTRPNLDPGEGTVRNALFPVPSWVGPRTRLTARLDLDAGRLDVFFDDRRAPMAGIQGPPIAPGESLASNDWSHFGLGGVGPGASAGHDELGGDGDFGIFGFRVGNACPYDATGPTLARADGRPITDAFRYFRAGPDLVGLLAGTDAAADVIAERRITLISGVGGVNGAATSGYVLDRRYHGNPFLGVQDAAIEDMGIACADHRFGDALKLGAASQLRVERCKLIGGARGLAAFNMATAMYPVTIRDVQADGSHSSIHLFAVSNSHLSDLRLGFDRGEQKQLVTLVNGGATIDHVFSPFWGKPDYGFFGERASATLRHWGTDAESPGLGAQVADVRCSPVQDNQPDNPLAIEDYQCVHHGPVASAVLLTGPPPGSNGRKLIGDAFVRISGLGVHRYSPLRSLVHILPDADGLWRDAGIDPGRAIGPDGKPRVAIEGGSLVPTATAGGSQIPV